MESNGSGQEGELSEASQGGDEYDVDDDDPSVVGGTISGTRARPDDIGDGEVERRSKRRRMEGNWGAGEGSGDDMNDSPAVDSCGISEMA